MRNRSELPLSQIRIVLFGSEGGFSRPVFEQLLVRGLCVSAVAMMDTMVENKDFPVGVRQVARLGGLEQCAQKNKVDILKTHTLRDKAFIKQLSKKQADVLLIACFAQKIPARIWQKMNLPCWNLHPSLLPQYRGPSPLHWQIENGETNTGLTLHQISGRFDAGNIIGRKILPLPSNQDKDSLDYWVAENGVDLFRHSLIRHTAGKLNAEMQDETCASYFPYVA